MRSFMYTQLNPIREPLQRGLHLLVVPVSGGRVRDHEQPFDGWVQSQRQLHRVAENDIAAYAGDALGRAIEHFSRYRRGGEDDRRAWKQFVTEAEGELQGA